MGASGQTNWRINQSFYDWSMDMEKRLMHEERRKPPPSEGHTYVEGLGAQSNRVYDWSDVLPQTNGFWYSEPGALNAPDTNSYFMGRTQVDEDGDGVQWATAYRPPDLVDGTIVDEPMDFPQPTYTRRFYFDEDIEQTVFLPWEQESGGGGGSSAPVVHGEWWTNTAGTVPTATWTIRGSWSMIDPTNSPRVGCSVGNTTPGVFSVDYDGWYVISALVTWAAATVPSRRIAALWVDGVQQTQWEQPFFSDQPSGSPIGSNVNKFQSRTATGGAVTMWLKAGAQISVQGYQNSGVDIVWDTTQGAYNHRFSIASLGQGPKGDPGPPGPTPTVGFAFSQATAATIWTIDHPLSFNPNVTVVDSAGDRVEGDVRYMSASQVRLTFSAAFAGTAYLS